MEVDGCPASVSVKIDSTGGGMLMYRYELRCPEGRFHWMSALVEGRELLPAHERRLEGSCSNRRSSAPC